MLEGRRTVVIDELLDISQYLAVAAVCNCSLLVDGLTVGLEDSRRLRV